jgi:hypothetical protein
VSLAPEGFCHPLPQTPWRQNDGQATLKKPGVEEEAGF